MSPASEEHSRLLLGLDMGGTGTRLAVETEEGAALGVFEGGPGNPVRSGPDAVAASLIRLFDAARDVLRRGDWAAMCVGMAGRSHPAAAGVLTTALEGWPKPPIRHLTDDGRTALAAALGHEDGLLVHAGTGSGAVAQKGGSTRRFGGFGPVLGDEGSGHAVGLAAVRVVCRAADGRGPPTPLVARVLSHLGDIEPRQLPFAASRDQIAFPELLPIVCEVAESGDPLAAELLRQAGADLALLAREAAKACGFEGVVPVATAGSIPGRVRPIREAFAATLTAEPGRFRLGPHVEEAWRGALFLARADLARGRPRSDW